MKKIFIVPYRDREAQKAVFLSHMKILLEDENDYEIIFVHQKDQRQFNRGGMRNIGFLYVKEKYENWKNMTLIFHDIDYLPYKKLFDYDTTKNVVTHFYGMKFSFGGIWAIKGEDYAKIGGYPNFWAWGFEDNTIKNRWVDNGGEINYKKFIFYTDPRVVKLDCSNHGHDARIINKNNLFYAKKDHPLNGGYHTIRDLKYNIEEIDTNIKMINVVNFLTETPEKNQRFKKNVTSQDLSNDLRLRKIKAKYPRNQLVHHLLRPATKKIKKATTFRRPMGGVMTKKNQTKNKEFTLRFGGFKV